MFDNYIGRSCWATIAFGEAIYNGGSGPSKIKGVLEAVDKDYIVLSGKGEKFIISIKALLVLNVVD